MVQAKKKVALLHRYPKHQIKATNAAFPYLEHKGMDILTFKTFDRLTKKRKFLKSLLWIFYAPLLVIGKKYDVIYCDDSFPFYSLFVKIVSPRSRVIKRMGDLHLMYYTSGLLYKILHWIEKIEWKTIDLVIPISKVMRDYISHDINTVGLSIANDPVDPTDWPFANMLKETSEKIVMFHGTLTKNKNVEFLLEAAYHMPKIKFRIVGDGPDRKRLEQLAPFNVEFLGWKPFEYMYKYINQCNVGVALRSDNRGNEYVVTSPFLQYGAMQKPCLVTRRKVFGDYEWQFTGYREFQEKLEKLLSMPEEGLKLYEYVMKHHNAQKIAEDIWNILLQ